MDTKKIFQSVTTGPDQDRAAIPHFIIGYWDVFAETPLSDKSLLRLVFKENGSHPPNSMLFYPEFSSLYESRADATNYAKTIEKFTRFCSERVVDLDLSNAIVPKWYCSRISEFSRLQSLRISHKSIDLTTALPLPDSLTCINLVDFPFDTGLLDFIRDIDGLGKVILTRCYSSQATAPVTRINYGKFEDWIRIYSNGLNKEPFHASIASIALIDCDEQLYDGILRLSIPSLKNVDLSLRNVYPGSGILRHTEAACQTSVTAQNWPMIQNITFFIDALDRAEILHKIKGEKSARSGYTFERLIRETIDNSIINTSNFSLECILTFNSTLKEYNAEKP